MIICRHIRFGGILIFCAWISMSTAWAWTPDYYESDRGFTFTISGSWNTLNNHQLNSEYIKSWISTGHLDDKIEAGYGISPELSYFFSPKISLGAGLIFIDGSTSKDRTAYDVWSGEEIHAREYVKTSIYAPAFLIKYHAYLDNADISFGFGESLLLGEVSRRHIALYPGGGFNEIKDNYSATGMGFQLFSGISIKLNRLVSYTMQAGYRHFKTGDLTENGTDVPLRAFGFFGGSPINLDYSGVFIAAGITINRL